MKDPELIRWCQNATAKIRFTPDREAVCEELLQHMEDKYDALLDAEVPESQIPEQILRSMGSAEELAPQLAAIHRPFWGYLEHITRYIVYAMTVALCIALLNLFSIYGPNLMEDLFTPEVPEEGTTFDADATAWSDGYLLQVNDVTILPGDPEIGSLSFAIIEIDIYGLLAQEISLAAICDFWAEDDLGNYYYSDSESTYDDDMRISYSSPRLGLFHTSHKLRLWGFDPAARWLRLHYDRDGRDITLHIDLTGGAEG